MLGTRRIKRPSFDSITLYWRPENKLDRYTWHTFTFEGDEVSPERKPVSLAPTLFPTRAIDSAGSKYISEHPRTAKSEQYK